MQHRTSAGTSINARKLPILYSKLAKAGVLAHGTGIDLGCGKYTDHIADFVHAQGGTVMFYDPYNQPATVNAETLFHRNRSHYCICSNVLNVIDDDDAVRDVIRKAVALGNGIAYFTVYEGNGTGIGSETQKGLSWQRNMKLHKYAAFCIGFDVEFSDRMMIVTDRQMLEKSLPERGMWYGYDTSGKEAS